MRLRILLALFLFLAPMLNASDPKPLWSVDLRGYGVKETDASVVTFCGPSLAVYPDLNRPPLMFDVMTHQLLAEGRCPQMPLSVLRVRLQPDFNLPDSSGRVVARWKQLSIIQVCDQPICAQPPGKPSVRETRFYLRAPGQTDRFIWHADCLPDLPFFVSPDRIVVFTCAHAAIVDDVGHHVAKLPSFMLPFFTATPGGARFAVYDTDESFWHELEGTADYFRVKVFRTSDGKELFHVRWHLNSDDINHGRVALSDDGTLVAILRSAHVLIFALPR